MVSVGGFIFTPGTATSGDLKNDDDVDVSGGVEDSTATAAASDPVDVNFDTRVGVVAVVASTSRMIVSVVVVVVVLSITSASRTFEISVALVSKEFDIEFTTTALLSITSFSCEDNVVDAVVVVKPCRFLFRPIFYL